MWAPWPSGGTAFFAKKAVGKKAQGEGPSDGPLPLDPLPSTAKEGILWNPFFGIIPGLV